MSPPIHYCHNCGCDRQLSKYSGAGLSRDERSHVFECDECEHIVDINDPRNKRPITPWSDKNSPWKSQAAYFTWLRGGLRRLWMRNPISIKFKNSLCRKALPSDGFSKQTKFVGQCARCGKWHAKSKLEVDHIEPAGALARWEDVEGFVRRLLGASSESLRLLCKPCHGIVTDAERFQCSEEESILRKRVILFSKLPAADQKVVLTQNSLPEGGNAKERRAIYYTHIIQNP